ncbi:hypothetical protein IKG49_00015 [Candidatus Saccharibacteria bacterium]|nr:hypothetical protein [Candidatus Saccharibacteria bacterium]
MAVTQKTLILAPQEILCQDWCGIYVASEEDLVALGSDNLRYLKGYWRREERRLKEFIRSIQSRLDVVAGSIDGIRKIAEKYDKPIFTEMGSFGLRKSEIEPLDTESKCRRYDATTFNFCGWCKYAEGDTGHFGYWINPRCLLLPEEYGNGSGKGEYECTHFFFNTDCVISGGTQDILDVSYSYLASELEKAKCEKAKVGGKIRIITSLAEKAENKPPFSFCRPERFFKPGERIVHCNPDSNGLKIVTGTVMDGHGFGEGLVPIHEDTSQGESITSWVSSVRPEILHEWEWDYLFTHMKYLRLFLRAARYYLADERTARLEAFMLS